MANREVTMEWSQQFERDGVVEFGRSQRQIMSTSGALLALVAVGVTMSVSGANLIGGIVVALAFGTALLSLLGVASAPDGRRPAERYRRQFRAFLNRHSSV